MGYPSTMPIKIQPPRLIVPQTPTFSIYYKVDHTNAGVILPTELNIHFECMRCRATFQKNCQNDMNVDIKEQDAVREIISEQNTSSTTKTDTRLMCKCSKELFIHFTEHLTTNNVNITTCLVNSFLFSCICGIFYYEMSDRAAFNCYECNIAISIRYKDVIIKPVSTGKESTTVSQIVKNKPLPNNGTCSHYKRSFRWFLFPCCNKLYPCDICHDQNEQHNYEFAKKILCGFCSNWKCDCESKKGSSSHWNGGKGIRDKSKMSKKDKQKYKR